MYVNTGTSDVTFELSLFPEVGGMYPVCGVPCTVPVGIYAPLPVLGAISPNEADVTTWPAESVAVPPPGFTPELAGNDGGSVGIYASGVVVRVRSCDSETGVESVGTYPEKGVKKCPSDFDPAGAFGSGIYAVFGIYAVL